MLTSEDVDQLRFLLNDTKLAKCTKDAVRAALDTIAELSAALDAKTAAMDEMHQVVNRSAVEYTAMSEEVALLRRLLAGGS